MPELVSHCRGGRKYTRKQHDDRLLEERHGRSTVPVKLRHVFWQAAITDLHLSHIDECTVHAKWYELSPLHRAFRNEKPRDSHVLIHVSCSTITTGTGSPALPATAGPPSRVPGRRADPIQRIPAARHQQANNGASRLQLDCGCLAPDCVTTRPTPIALQASCTKLIYGGRHDMALIRNMSSQAAPSRGLLLL